MIRLVRGSALPEALLATLLLALGTTTHLHMLAEALHEQSNNIWHKRAQDLNQALRARLLAPVVDTDTPAYAAAVTTWQQAARNHLPGGSAELGDTYVLGLRRLELRTSWASGGRPGVAVLYLYRGDL